jgi:hypothetical protein
MAAGCTKLEEERGGPFSLQLVWIQADGGGRWKSAERAGWHGLAVRLAGAGSRWEDSISTIPKRKTG